MKRTRAALREWCRRDREFLVSELRRLFPRNGFVGERPAELLDDIITEVLDFDLVEVELPRGQLAECDFDERVVRLSTRMAESVRPGTNLAALANSTKAHELGHIRLHEGELATEDAQERMTGTLFPELGLPSRRLVTYRDEERPRLGKDERRREWEADLYAAVFLVPEAGLAGRREFLTMRSARAEGRELSSSQLWRLTYSLADWFSVSPTLMKNHLVELGLLEYDPSRRALCFSSQTLLGFGF